MSMADVGAPRDDDGGCCSLDSLPSEVIERITAFHQDSLHELLSANAVSRLFRGVPGGRSPVEHVLRARASARGHAHALPPDLPPGVSTWTEELLAREGVLAAARPHAHVAAAGASYYCAQAALVDASGALFTCGEEYDRAGERHVSPRALGQPERRDEPTRVATRVASLAAVRIGAVAAGVGHLLALSADGGVFGCGPNNYGQLGLGDARASATFAPVEALRSEHVVCIAAGGFHSLAISAAGCAFSFGFNRYGQLGHGGAQRQVPTPCRVEMPACDARARMAAAAAGLYHTLLLAADGAVYTCGLGAAGRLGHGDELDLHTPTRVRALSAVRGMHVSAGATHSVVVDRAGGVHTFGEGWRGCLGHGDEREQLLPKRVEALAGVHAARSAAGGNTTAVVDARGGVHTFGDNEHGVLGRRTAGPSTAEPGRVAALAHTPVAACSMGLSQSAYFVTADGSVHSCGRATGALGRGVGMGGAGPAQPDPRWIEELPRVCLPMAPP